MSLILQDLANTFDLIFSFWWIWLPLLLWYLLKTIWILFVSTKYYSSLKWVLLEIKVPEELTKGPKATEQVFAGLHGVFLPLNWKDKWLKGKLTQPHFSLEITGGAGEVRFYIRTLEAFKNIVESNIYAQYPEAEISEVDDYFNELPEILPNNEKDLWGNEFILAKENAYPIRTYPLFEDPSGEKEEKRIDPLASLAENLTNLKVSEKILLQILIRPRGEDWAKEAKIAADKVMGRPSKETPNIIQKFTDWINQLIGAEPKKEEKKEESASLLKLSPGEQDVLTAIERKAAKLGFDTGIRFLYIGPRDEFNRAYTSAVVGILKQFTTQNMNAFRMNTQNFTYVKYPFFKAFRDFRRKLNIYQKARWRSLTMFDFVFNTEELATIFHLPSINVKAPGVQKIEAKKGIPPSELPIE